MEGPAEGPQNVNLNIQERVHAVLVFKKETSSPAAVEVAVGQQVNQDTRTGGAYRLDNQYFQRRGHFGRERGPGSCWATVGWELLAFVGEPGHPAPIIQVLTILHRRS